MKRGSRLLRVRRRDGSVLTAYLTRSSKGYYGSEIFVNGELVARRPSALNFLDAQRDVLRVYGPRPA
jgi:hypothetical protein